MGEKFLLPLDLPEPADGPVMLEYVMVDQSRADLISRTYVVDTEPREPADCPQSKSINMYDSPAKEEPCPDILLIPVALFRDPFRLGRHKIVLCVPEYADGRDKNVVYNTRPACLRALESVADNHPWYGFEQEYFVVDKNGRPVDWDYYSPPDDWCFELNKGDNRHIERELLDQHMKACTFAGINIAGCNREASPSQWEYQVGPVEGIHAADQLVVSRYIMQRIAERNNIYITFGNPAAVRQTDGRAALHLNFSTEETRANGGIEVIHQYLDNMKNHSQEAVMKYYDLAGGEEMRWFLSGDQYMPHYDRFICKVGDKDECTIRIPTVVVRDGKGYFEERRPISDADPYDVCKALTMAAMFKTNGF